MENNQNLNPKAKSAYTPRRERPGRLKFTKSLHYIRDGHNQRHDCLETLGPFEGQRALTLYWHNGADDCWVVKVEMSWAKLLEICGGIDSRVNAKEILNER